MPRREKPNKGEKATKKQLEILFNFMSENPFLVTGKARKFLTLSERNKSWESLMPIINNIPNGCSKSTVKWQRTWEHLIFETKKKRREVYSGLVKDGIYPLYKKISQLLSKVDSLVSQRGGKITQQYISHDVLNKDSNDNSEINSAVNSINDPMVVPASDSANSTIYLVDDKNISTNPDDEKSSMKKNKPQIYYVLEDNSSAGNIVLEAQPSDADGQSTLKTGSEECYIIIDNSATPNNVCDSSVKNIALETQHSTADGHESPSQNNKLEDCYLIIDNSSIPSHSENIVPETQPSSDQKYTSQNDKLDLIIDNSSNISTVENIVLETQPSKTDAEKSKHLMKTNHVPLRDSCVSENPYLKVLPNTLMLSSQQQKKSSTNNGFVKFSKSKRLRSELEDANINKLVEVEREKADVLSEIANAISAAAEVEEKKLALEEERNKLIHERNVIETERNEIFKSFLEALEIKGFL